MNPPPNIVKFRLDGFPLDALDQKRMRRLRRTSDRTGKPIPDLISEVLDRTVEAWIAEAELPNKIVKFPAALVWRSERDQQRNRLRWRRTVEGQSAAPERHFHIGTGERPLEGRRG
jgi:hypothetical protein